MADIITHLSLLPTPLLQGGQQCGIALSPEPSAAMPGSGEEPDLLKRSWKQEGVSNQKDLRSELWGLV